MKQFYLLVIVIFATIYSFATTYTATKSGNWSDPTIWQGGVVPASTNLGDAIIINPGITVNADTKLTLSGVIIYINGTLNFPINGIQITLDATSGVSLAAGAAITGNSGNNSDKIIINGNSGPIVVYSSKNPPAGTGNETGPKSWGTAPQPIILPVKFASFNLAHQQANVLVQWSTAQEMNSKSFIIERSSDGANWTSIATVKAAGESNTILDYSYTDKNLSGTVFYYRIKEVDIDNSFSYTSIKSIKMDNASVDVKVIPASTNMLYVNFSQQVKSNVTMRLVSMSGQVVSQQTVSNPIGQVSFSTANHSTGIYVLSVTDGYDLALAKKVVL